MAIINQILHRKNSSNEYDEIHVKTNATMVAMSTTDSTTVATEIANLKSSVSNGKSAVASAITDKGISTSATATFDTMATNIRSIPTGTPRTSDDLTVNGPKVTAPAGLYATAATTNVKIGSAGTPTASKGTVSNNQITVTPSVENVTGYIDGGTITGTGVTVSASELVSGNKALSSSASAQSGIDVTNYATVSISAMGAGAISAADSSISGNSFTPTLTYDSTNTRFNFGGSANATGTAYAKITTAGYLTSSSNTSKSLSATVSATGYVARVGTGVTISGTTTKQPAISRTAKPSGDTWTDAANGAATTTKPTSGVYVQVNTAANTGTLTATPKVTSNGYGTTSYYGSTAGTATVGASASAATYVPIKTGSASTPATTKAQSTPSITVSSAGLITASVAATSVSVTPTVSAGYVSSGTAGTVTMSASSNTKQLTTKAATTITPSSSAQTAVASGVYTTGAITVAAVPTETKTATANGTVTPTSGKFLSSVTVSIPVYDGSVS